MSEDIVIDRPPVSVWPCVADLELDRQWRRPYVTDRRADGDPLEVGTQITGTIRYAAQNLLGRMLSPAMLMFLRRVVAPRFMRQIRELAERTDR